MECFEIVSTAAADVDEECRVLVRGVGVQEDGVHISEVEPFNTIPSFELVVW